MSTDTTRPQKHPLVKKAEVHNAEIAATISMLCIQWDLRLPIPKPDDSPSKRKALGQAIEYKCVHRIKVLQYKNVLSVATTRFRTQAEILYSGWVNKPKAERGLVPQVSRDRVHPVTDAERKELLEALLDILDDEFEKIPPTPSLSRYSQDHDDSAIPSKLPKTMKRSSGDHFDDIPTASKKQKPEGNSKESQELMPPPQSRDHAVDHSFTQNRQPTLNHDDSFVSNNSSIFSRPPSLRRIDTQTTTPDDEPVSPTQENTQPLSPVVDNVASSDYGSSQIEQHIKDSFDANGMLLSAEPPPPEPSPEPKTFDERLTNVFPELHISLRSLDFPMLFEITRVCLHAEVSLKDFKLYDSQNLDNYDILWSKIRDNPILKGKNLPARSNPEVWKAISTNFSRASRAIVFSGSLTPSTNSKTIFRLQLQPLRFDDSHRLGRRFGNDRFLELDLPPIVGRKAPPALQDGLTQAELISWLIDGKHTLFGRTWKPFHVKPNEKRGRKLQSQSDDEFDTAHRIYFFAVDGIGFQDTFHPLRPCHERMTIRRLLDLTRPIDINSGEKFLKLFARTDLVVSKNTPTVVLDPFQIIYKDDIRVEYEVTDETGKKVKKYDVMTDGAGQMSYKLALEITSKLGLSFVPSGFQGRIGEAKGFWSIDYQDRSDRVWITVYASQRKWKKNANDHESHRTFEVVRWSAPLKAADLNLQLLPLLQDRAEHPRIVELALKSLLDEGFQRRLNELQSAMTDPLALKVWLRENLASPGERLKEGCVPYRAAFPTSIDEKMNLLLDCGLGPETSPLARDLARKAFKAKCDELQRRLNIKVSKSTYCYMVPDFAGVLEADEVYLDISRFTDQSSDFATSSILLNGMELLVARSPAHYVSDIQKVRAVNKVELMGLKDVIVFSTKGHPSLAAKLSGGDYDGDQAWVCWEPSIVENFQNAEVPFAPNLVKEGVLTQNLVTYKELVQGVADPTSTFLNESFLFNTQQKMLGICTAFKENLCYAMKTVNSDEAARMSTLLSYLVDQAKQGYIFTEDDWERFKSSLNRVVEIPSYKTDQLNYKSNHIIDRLMIAAKKKVDQLLTDFHQNTPHPPKRDPDLGKYYMWAKTLANGGNEHWQSVIQDLDADIKSLMKDWSTNATLSMRSDEDGSSNNYLPRADITYAAFISIRPHVENCITQVLLPSCLPDEHSDWALLRASALYANYNRSTVIWNIAGKWLTRLKFKFGGSGFGHTVTPVMYAMLRPDAPFVKKYKSERGTGAEAFDENASVVNAEELENFED